MPKAISRTNQKSALHRATSAVKRLFSRGRDVIGEALEPLGEEPRTIPYHPKQRKQEPKASHPVRREADIPLDLLEREYTPPVTSSKASFRSDGSDHELDQEFAYELAGDRWNDEDRYTNKSGDPRIGTHGRKSEPDEARE